ncbi:hypothetical protein BaRGS_00033796 [Batillaria attramentaria]|uniref:Uncharacterized protein n=1 Tax=Batillaria attramentaria TaxID=370345 RepID=A0ABD0JJZ6_9CAEN
MCLFPKVTLTTREQHVSAGTAQWDKLGTESQHPSSEPPTNLARTQHVDVTPNKFSSNNLSSFALHSAGLVNQMTRSSSSFHLYWP